MSTYPNRRMRRKRNNAAIRKITRETSLSVNDFIYPIFVTYGKRVQDNIEAMPGINRVSIDNLKKEVDQICDLGIQAIILFGIPEVKDSVGSNSYNPNGIIQLAIKEIRKTRPDILIITDVCMCEYTDHGHCGITENGSVNNDKTLDILAKISTSHVEAGSDIVAPSAMMDGQVSAIRSSLDQNGYVDSLIMAYSAKYASGFYGPFREAAMSAPSYGDRQSYQLDKANIREAMEEIRLDVEEGADIIMVKPALSYLDVISAARNGFSLPIASYNVSGEYSMIKAAAQNGWIDEKRIALEILTSIKRAGADMIITYYAKEAAKWLSKTN
ncbi:MAG: porphobilinogen synthase [SAR202 cluster bacterium]|nr:porphobilinogen synthase [SAR202 cluster bacterium]|tara:strand:+ start:57782 stop:58765 length:984 start_codon:yes stop_codon:yes gene_type:complete